MSPSSLEVTGSLSLHVVFWKLVHPTHKTEQIKSHYEFVRLENWIRKMIWYIIIILDNFKTYGTAKTPYYTKLILGQKPLKFPQ